jgi:hypothetical protein
MKIAFTILMLPLLCSAGEAPAEVRAIADRASGLPAEFAADALIRIAGIEKLDKAVRIQLLEDAFRRAGSAQQPFRRRPASFRFDGISGYLDKAYSQELDGLSLQSRAVEAMLPLAPGKARQLFTELPTPRLPKLVCTDSLTYDVSRFYSVLGKVAAGPFSEKEIKEEEPFKLLMRYASITSPAQIGPMAEVIANAKVTDGQFQGLVATFGGALKQLSSDDRSFTAARPYGVQIRQLRDAAQKRGTNPVALLESYRAYLVRHLTGARCADTSTLEVRVALESIATAIPETQMAANAGPYFNETLRIEPVPALTPEEQTPAKTEGEATGLKGCSSGECKAIGNEYRSLVMRDQGIAIRPDERETAEWQSKLKAFLTSMAEWKADTGATPIEHFRYKVMLYSDLLAVTPPGPNRDLVLRATHDYLRTSRMENESRIEWFLPTNVLLGRVLLDPLGLGKFSEELRGSGDAVISLYAELDRVAPRTPDKVVPLF